MISHEHRTIFIHVPKCAGTIIENAFGHGRGANVKGSQDYRSIREIKPLKLTDVAFLNLDNARLIYRRYRKAEVLNLNIRLVVNGEQYNEYLKFAIVRNPYSRAYSWYRRIMRYPINLFFLRTGFARVI